MQEPNLVEIDFEIYSKQVVECLNFRYTFFFKKDSGKKKKKENNERAHILVGRLEASNLVQHKFV